MQVGCWIGVAATICGGGGGGTDNSEIRIAYVGTTLNRITVENENEKPNSSTSPLMMI